jgi:hypothetical protein
MTNKDKIKLTEEQCAYFKEALEQNCFNIGALAIKVLEGRDVSDKVKKEYLTRILNGKRTISSVELAKLEVFATAHIVPDIYFKALKRVEEHYIAGLNLFPELLGEEVCTE